MSQNKSVEEVVEEINECIRINSNASICTNCAGGGYDYEESRDCKKCNASGITNWDFDYLNKRLTEIIRQERQTSQEREREIVEAILEKSMGVYFDKHDHGDAVSVEDIQTIAQKYNITLTNPKD